LPRKTASLQRWLSSLHAARGAEPNLASGMRSRATTSATRGMLTRLPAGLVGAYRIGGAR
jgi:hypothetical protein